MKLDGATRIIISRASGESFPEEMERMTRRPKTAPASVYYRFPKLIPNSRGATSEPQWKRRMSVNGVRRSPLAAGESNRLGNARRGGEYGKEQRHVRRDERPEA